MKIRRPLWRSFNELWVKNAIEHVRAGGHALLWRSTGSTPSAWMLLPTHDGALPELSFWSVLALEKNDAAFIESGFLEGFATMRIPRHYEDAVERWCERDSQWEGTTREIELDCLACGACCRNNRVLLDPDDFYRWEAAGRDELRGRPYVRRVDGKLLLKLQKDGRCVHLLDDNKCNIYELRPDNCRLFPAGSEPCLESRREELDLID